MPVHWNAWKNKHWMFTLMKFLVDYLSFSQKQKTWFPSNRNLLRFQQWGIHWIHNIPIFYFPPDSILWYQWRKFSLLTQMSFPFLNNSFLKKTKHRNIYTQSYMFKSWKKFPINAENIFHLLLWVRYIRSLEHDNNSRYVYM